MRYVVKAVRQGIVPAYGEHYVISNHNNSTVFTRKSILPSSIYEELADKVLLLLCDTNIQVGDDVIIQRSHYRGEKGVVTAVDSKIDPTRPYKINYHPNSLMYVLCKSSEICKIIGEVEDVDLVGKTFEHYWDVTLINMPNLNPE